MNMAVRALALLTITACMAKADQVVQKPRVEAAGDPVMVWNMSGGIAGFCEELSVWLDGKVQARTCKFGGRVRPGKLAKEDVARLARWTKTLGSVSIGQRDAGVADSLALTMKLRGRGDGQPSESEKQDMLEWAQATYNANRP